jgi:hypothetical protein
MCLLRVIFGRGQARRAPGTTIILEIAAQDFPARPGPGHRVPARIAHLCHVRFDAGSEATGARHNTGTQFLKIGLAHLSGYRHREHAVLAGWRQLGQMRFYAGLDPAFAGRINITSPDRLAAILDSSMRFQKRRMGYIRKPASSPERRRRDAVKMAYATRSRPPDDMAAAV